MAGPRKYKTKEDFKNEKKLPRLTRQLSKNLNKVKKLKQQETMLTGEDKEAVSDYVKELKTRINWIVNSITQEKIEGARLTHQIKALKVLSDRAMIAEDKEEKTGKKDNVKKEIKLNLNTKDLTKDELLEILNKKAQENQQEE